MIDILDQNSIPYNWINTNDPEIIYQRKSDPRKIYGDIYIEAKSLFSLPMTTNGFVDWPNILAIVNRKTRNYYANTT